jgi:hypothetical protein
MSLEDSGVEGTEPSVSEEVSQDSYSQEVSGSEDSQIEDSGEVSRETLANMSLEELREFRELNEKELQEPGEEDDYPAGDLQGNQESEYPVDVPENAEEQRVEGVRPQPEPNQQLNELANVVSVRREGINNLKTQHIQTLNFLESKAREIAVDDPREAAKLDREAERVHEELVNLDGNLRELDQYEQNLKVVPKFIPHGQLFPDEIVEGLVEDGWSEDRAQDYVQNMFAREKPATVIALAKNGILRRAVKALLHQNGVLEKNPQQFPKRIPPSSKPRSADQVAEVINRARTIPKTMTPAPSTQSAEPTMSREDLAAMSLDELRALKKQVMRGHV